MLLTHLCLTNVQLIELFPWAVVLGDSDLENEHSYVFSVNSNLVKDLKSK